MKLVVIWYNHKENLYYHRIVSGYYTNYVIGYKNQYGHEIIYTFELKTCFKVSRTKMVLSRFIRFLQKLEKKL